MIRKKSISDIKEEKENKIKFDLEEYHKAKLDIFIRSKDRETLNDYLVYDVLIPDQSYKTYDKIDKYIKNIYEYECENNYLENDSNKNIFSLTKQNSQIIENLKKTFTYHDLVNIINYYEYSFKNEYANLNNSFIVKNIEAINIARYELKLKDKKIRFNNVPKDCLDFAKEKVENIVNKTLELKSDIRLEFTNENQKETYTIEYKKLKNINIDENYKLGIVNIILQELDNKEINEEISFTYSPVSQHQRSIQNTQNERNLNTNFNTVDKEIDDDICF